MLGVVVRVTGGALLLIMAGITLSQAVDSPTVNVYTQTPVEFGVQNVLICNTNAFHPPLIDIRLKKDGRELPNCDTSDLSFQRDWKYFMTKHVTFTPEEGAAYECEVTHNGRTQTHRLDIF